MKRKDMHMQGFVGVLGLLLVIAGIVLAVLAGMQILVPVNTGVAAAVCVLMGLAALMCWKNVWAEMLNDEEFVYSSMLGKKQAYRFADVLEIKRAGDTRLLVLKDATLRIEIGTVFSDRFLHRLAEAALANAPAAEEKE